jgi:hypothetical protein
VEVPGRSEYASGVRGDVQLEIGWWLVLATTLFGCGNTSTSTGPSASNSGGTQAGGSSPGGTRGGESTGNGGGGDIGGGAGASATDADELFVSSEGELRSLIVDGESLYFTERTFDAQQNATRHVLRMPKSGGETTTLGEVAEIEMGVNIIAADDQRVYWLDYGVSFVDQAGGETGHWEAASPAALTRGHWSIAVDETHVYAADITCENLTQFDKGTGESVVVPGSTEYRGGGAGLLVTDEVVYCAATTGVHQWTKPALEHAVINTTSGRPSLINRLGDELFWIDDQTAFGDDSVWRGSLDGSGAVLLGTVGRGGNGAALLADPSRQRLYFAKVGITGFWLITADGTISTFSPESLVFGEFDQDDEHLYFVSSSEVMVQAGDRILRIAKP